MLFKTLLLGGIRIITIFAGRHEDESVELVTNKKRAEADRSLRDKACGPEHAQLRIRILDEISQNLYEDNFCQG